MISCLDRLKCRWLNHAAAKLSPTTLPRNAKETTARELAALPPRGTPQAADKPTRELQVTRENMRSLETKVSKVSVLADVERISVCVPCFAVYHSACSRFTVSKPEPLATVHYVFHHHLSHPHKFLLSLIAKRLSARLLILQCVFSVGGVWL